MIRLQTVFSGLKAVAGAINRFHVINRAARLRLLV